MDRLTNDSGQRLGISAEPKRVKVNDLVRLRVVIERAKEIRGGAIGMIYNDGAGGSFPFPEILEAFLEHLDSYAKD